MHTVQNVPDGEMHHVSVRLYCQADNRFAVNASDCQPTGLHINDCYRSPWMKEDGEQLLQD